MPSLKYLLPIAMLYFSCHLKEIEDFSGCPNPPIASFTPDMATCVAPCTISFVNNSVNATNYLWDYGDGAVSNSVSPLPHEYTVGGTYLVKLVATNDGSCRDTFVQSIVIGDASPKPKAIFRVTNDSCTVPCEITFTNQSLNANRYEWNFDDNATVNTQVSPKHTYQNPGVYHVSLKAYNLNNEVDDTIITVTIKSFNKFIKYYENQTVMLEARFLTQTPDKGFFLVGQNIGIFGGYNIAVMKLDETGEPVWMKNIDAPSGNKPVGIVRENDGVVICYRSDTQQGGIRIALLKTDLNGMVLWDSVYTNNNYNEIPGNIAKTKNGDYLICGSSDYNSGVQSSKALIMRVNNSGQRRWVKYYSYPNMNYNELNAVSENNTYDYLRAYGSSKADASSALDNLYMISTDANGNVINQNQIVEPGVSQYFISTLGSNYGGYETVCGFSHSSDGNILVGLVDIALHLLTRKIFGQTKEDQSYKIIPTSDGASVICGYTYQPSNGSADAFLMKLDQSNEMLWFQNYGTAAYEIAAGVIQTSDGGFALVGYKFGPPSKMMFIKTDPDGHAF